MPLEVFVIPVPLQTPPDVAALKLNALALEHTADTGVMEELGTALTEITSWSLPVQAPVTLYVIVKVPTPETDGLNAPVEVLVIPVPLHVPPPGVALRVKVGEFAHKGLTALTDTVATELTVTVAVAEAVQLLLVPVTV